MSRPIEEDASRFAGSIIFPYRWCVRVDADGALALALPRKASIDPKANDMSLDVTFWAVSEHATAAGVQRELQLQHVAVSQGPAWFQFGHLYQDARIHLPDEPRASWDYFFAALVWDARSAQTARASTGTILRKLSASDVTALAAVVGFLWARYHGALASALARTIATDDHAWFTVPTALSFVEDLRTLTLDAAHHGEGVLIVAGAALPSLR